MGEVHADQVRTVQVSSDHLVHSKDTFATEPFTGSLSLLPNVQVYVYIPK